MRTSERMEKLCVDLPTLQAIAARTWGKEDELKTLKAELATLDQKITSELAPKQEKQDLGEDVKHDEPTQCQRAETPAQSPEAKETMVAEPLDRGYGQHHKLNIPLVICDCNIASVGNLRTGGLKL